MSTPLKIFEADQSSIWLTLGISVAGAILSLAVLVYLRRNEGKYDLRHYRQLGLMLSGLVLLIALGSIIGSVLNLQRLQPIKVYEDRVVTGFGSVAYTDLRFLYLHKGKQMSFVSPDVSVDTTLLAYFEEKQGKSYVISEENYDVEAIVAYIRPMMDSLTNQ